MSEKHVVVIGGGVTGLSAAWRLRQLVPGIHVTVLEADDRWGGKVLTSRFGDAEGNQFVFDAGPESFVTRKPEVWQLANELDLQQALFEPASETKGMYILHDGLPFEVPLAPHKFVTSRIMSPAGKLRMLAEPFTPPKRDDADESLADFVTRRLGREALEQFLGPILGGIYNADPETQSILTTSPVMREMEAEHGSLVRASIARMGAARAKRKALAARGESKPPSFVTFRNGAQVLTDTLAARLNGSARLSSPVTALTDADGRIVVATPSNEYHADAVVVTTPANAAATLLRPLAPDAAALLARIAHKHIGTVGLAFRNSDIALDLPIRGLMIPRKENRCIDALTWASLKVPGRAPAGFTVLRAFFGGAQPAVAELDDDALLPLVRDELRQLLGIAAAPVAFRAHRWLDSFPQAAVGHLALVDDIEAALPPNVVVAGASYRGIGVPDCVRQANTAATRIAQRLA